MLVILFPKLLWEALADSLLTGVTLWYKTDININEGKLKPMIFFHSELHAVKYRANVAQLWTTLAQFLSNTDCHCYW